jgi:hypothetical protein
VRVAHTAVRVSSVASLPAPCFHARRADCVAVRPSGQRTRETEGGELGKETQGGNCFLLFMSTLAPRAIRLLRIHPRLMTPEASLAVVTRGLRPFLHWPA